MAKAKKTELVVDLDALKATFLAEGYKSSSVDAVLANISDYESAKNILNIMKLSETIETEKVAKEKKEKTEKKEKRETDIQSALEKVCGSNVPEMYNSIRMEKRFSKAPKNIPEGRETTSNDAGEITKIHDRDLVGIRFTSKDGLNFCFQVEVPFSRRGKMDLTNEEHANLKNEMLTRIHSVIMGTHTEKGEFISL